MLRLGTFQISLLLTLLVPFAAHKVKLKSGGSLTTASAVAFAEIAFEQNRISRGVLSGVKNASLLAEAARSSGLAWDVEDAQRHIAKVAAELDPSLISSSQSRKGPKLTMGGLQKKTVDFLEDDDQTELVGNTAFATVSLMADWANGDATWEDAYAVGRDLVIGMIGLANPILGSAVAFAFSFFEGILGFGNKNEESPEQILYKKVMKDTAVMITKEQLKDELGERVTELTVMMDEMKWVPSMLSDVKGDDFGHTLLTFYLMLQHDIAKMSAKIQRSNFGKTEKQNIGEDDWNRISNQWSAAMVPITNHLMSLQVNLILQISSWSGKEGKKAAQDRLDAILSGYQKFFEYHMPKFEDGTRSDMEAALAWNDAVPFMGDYRQYPKCNWWEIMWRHAGCAEREMGEGFHKEHCFWITRGKGCKFAQWDDACGLASCTYKSNKVACHHWDMHTPSISNACTKSDMLGFWDNHVVTHLAKQRKMAEAMYKQSTRYLDASSRPCGLDTGNNMIEIGHWRIAAIDGNHASISNVHGKTAQIFRNHDGTLHPGPRTDWGGYKITRKHTLTAMAKDGIKFGDHFIQIGNFRIGASKHLSISTSKGKTCQIFGADGRHWNGPRSDWGFWDRPTGSPKGIRIGNGFLQIGDFILGDVGQSHFSISNAKTKKTAVIYSPDGKQHYGPRDDWNFGNQKYCRELK